MSDFEHTNPRETLSSFAKLRTTSEPSVAGSSTGAVAAVAAWAPPPTCSPTGSAPVAAAKHLRRPKVRRLLANRRPGRTAWLRR